MCSPMQCKRCGKTTWTGCGQHVDSVMRNVPASQRCKGHEGEKPEGSFLGRIFGRA